MSDLATISVPGKRVGDSTTLSLHTGGPTRPESTVLQIVSTDTPPRPGMPRRDVSQIALDADQLQQLLGALQLRAAELLGPHEENEDV